MCPSLIKETGGCQHVTGCTCQHQDLNRLCPKISSITAREEPVGGQLQMNRLTFKTAGKLPIILEELKEYSLIQQKTRGCEHVTSWTCQHWDPNRLCPKISPITARDEPVGGQLQMNRLSLRINRLTFKTAGKLPIILEEFIEYTSIQ